MSLIFYYDKNLPKTTPLRQEYLQNQVIKLKNIFQPQQKSKEWYEMRNGMLTASDWGTILGENHYVSNSNTVLLNKCGDDNFVTNPAMEWGNKYEDVAVKVYEYRNNKTILEFGCLRHPFISFLGASPDGITPDGVMLEIKCPSSRKITGIPPSHYWCQVQGQLEVCELDRCDFIECSFKEYSEEEYLNDNYENDFKLNKFGNEKGLIAEFYKKDQKKFYYDYSPVCILGEELEKWKKTIVEKHISENIVFSCFSYWYLQEVSCVPIYRNQEWFQKAKVELEIFWNEVLKYRELGLEKLKEDLLIKKNNIKNEKIAKKEESVKKKVKTTPISTKKTKDVIILDYYSVEKKEKKEQNNMIIEKNTESSSEDSSNDEYEDLVFNTNVSMFRD
jgi:putative phage-type endonuclease